MTCVYASKALLGSNQRPCLVRIGQRLGAGGADVGKTEGDLGFAGTVALVGCRWYRSFLASRGDTLPMSATFTLARVVGGRGRI